MASGGSGDTRACRETGEDTRGGGNAGEARRAAGLRDVQRTARGKRSDRRIVSGRESAVRACRRERRARARRHRARRRTDVAAVSASPRLRWVLRRGAGALFMSLSRASAGTSLVLCLASFCASGDLAAAQRFPAGGSVEIAFTPGDAIDNLI